MPKSRKTIVITVNRIVTAAAAVLVFCAAPATDVRADDHGAELAYTCLGCHGIEGYRNAYPSFRVPKLGGQKAEYIEGALKAYREGTRNHPTMQAQGRTLSDEDIATLAAYFEGEQPAKDEVSPEMVAGVQAAAACLACHGTQAADGLVPVPPTLSGQYRDYIIHALGQYRSGERSGNIMNGFAAALTDDDIEAIATIWSQQDGLYTPDSDD